MAVPRRRVLLHGLDQDRASTASLGILNHTRSLLRHLAREDDPGFDVVVLLSRDSVSDLAPPDPPPWMDVLVHGRRYATGPRRVLADHGLVPWFARRVGASLIHYPKGWRSALVPAAIRTVVTMHDTIPDFLRERHPGETGRLKDAYFRLSGRLSAARSSHIITVSRYSRDCLCRRYPYARARITVIYQGPGIRCTPLPPEQKGDQVLVIGSLRPHKATREALALLAAHQGRRGSLPAVRVAGLDRWPPAWGPEPLPGASYLGRLADGRLADELARARALVLLSEMEGFGLPFVEAWASGTPVCFRDAHALAEIGAGFPGAWDGASPESFGRALDEVLGLDAGKVAVFKERVARTFRWDHAARETLAVYRAVLEDQAPGASRS